MRGVVAISASFFVVFAISQAQENQKQVKEKDGEKVELTGKLRTGIVAIGGETTGTIIETKKGRFELDFAKQKELRQKAGKLNGKTVMVVGTLKIRRGVEVKQR